MSWNEQNHPRDDDGKFTFKNGGDNKNKQTHSEILYKNSKIKKEEEMIKQKEKSKLLDTLKDKATPADILYGDEKSLSKKIKDYKLGVKSATPTGFAINANKTAVNDSKNQYMTPIEEQYKRNKGYSEIWEGDDNFKKAMVRMFNREKEYNNSKYDLGGETNLGITIGTLNDYKRKHPDFKDVDIKKITKDQASRIYYDEYWKESGENFDKYIEIRKKYYNDIVKNRPEQKDFIEGWMNRLNEIKDNRGKLL